MKIQKTIKLYIGGKFPRTESGRSYPEYKKGSKEIYANLCQSSRKDFRNTVEVAKSAVDTWGSCTPFLRSQILYRMAEMCEGKREEFVSLFEQVLGLDSDKANEQVDRAIDTFVFYAGFCDKFQQITATMNPVNGPFNNFTTPEPVGVVALVNEDKFDFQKLVMNICSIITGGNSVVALLGKECASVLAPLAEVFATSDLPAGVVNLLSGDLDEIAPFVGSHMEVKSVSFQNSNKKAFELIQKDAIGNLKRVVGPMNSEMNLSSITSFIEYKTIWQPQGY